ncbi:MAG: polymer-forming cytoskeletal protein [Akkermansiaceae bacterium]|nr:polymer-forming cytoskeletal protein [Akkermansiaceae bacterium]
MADEPKRHRIELVCPDCGHRQLEPAMVVSTQCRSCRGNFQVIDGKAVPRYRAATRLAKVRPEVPASEPQVKVTPFKPQPAVPPKLSLLRRLIFRQKPPREVTCFSCGHTHKAVAEAQSSQCPRCSAYISLRDYVISEPWNRRIQTRGDVMIEKSGVVSGITIQCHHLTVLGELAGSVDCSGDLVIRSHGKILGKVSCRQLRVERGARVEFLNPVTAASAYIDGNVRGQISCTGPITLAKRAHLQGLVKTASLVIKEGARHTGAIEMIQSPKS